MTLNAGSRCCRRRGLLEFLKGPVIRATFFFNLSRNIVALQVETLCCAYYQVCDQLVSRQNTVLQVEATCCSKLARVLLCATNFNFAARITTEATTCLATNLNTALLIGRREARQMADGKDG